MAYEKDNVKVEENLEQEQEELKEEVEEVEEVDDDEAKEEFSDKAKEEIEELTLKLTRMQADYNNLKRRSESEKKSSVDFGIEILACELLPIIDNFERALESENDKEASFYQGVKMIYTQLIEVLNRMCIKEIEALNNPFDPNFHDAVMVEESEEHDEGIVIDVLQKGYIFKDKVIRPSMVKVSK